MICPACRHPIPDTMLTRPVCADVRSRSAMRRYQYHPLLKVKAGESDLVLCTIGSVRHVKMFDADRAVCGLMMGVGGASDTAPPSVDLLPSLRVGGLLSPIVPPRFSPLCHSSAEMTDVAAAGTWDAKVLEGESATEGMLKRLPLGSYDVVHFAVHAAIDRDFPDRSGLVLTSHKGDRDDDLLQAREIRGLTLKCGSRHALRVRRRRRHV